MGSTTYFCFRKTRAAGVMEDKGLDEQYVERLLLVSEYYPGDLGVGRVS